MSDPNFPPNLNIHPLHLQGTSAAADQDDHEQLSAIKKYGIAGRVWEATTPMLEYLTPGNKLLEPPCSLFEAQASNTSRRILELGSGQALASLHLAARLPSTDTVVLTDLPAVVPLCEQSIAAWQVHGEGSRAAEHAQVVARPLAWGEDATHLIQEFGPLTHILMCDLIYFPHLYPPLLRTLLEVTEPVSLPLPEVKDGEDSDVFGPEIIMAWKSRSLNLEESFFDSFGHYFRLTPILGGQ